MLSNKPYLIRAFYDWIVDSRCTPILSVNANHPKCKLPNQPSENGEILFNISPEAIRDLTIRYDTLEFRASFLGKVQVISAPVKAILAVYAEENKQGMYFDFEEEDFFEEGAGSAGAPGKSHLRLVE